MKTFFKLLVILFFLSSCAHTLMRGTVAMKIDDGTAHVCLGDNDVKVGDRVNFLRNDCETVKTGFESTSGDRRDGDSADRRETTEVQCTLKKIGEGTITKLLNSHYSEVKTDSKFKFSESTIVQKQKL